MNRKAPGRARIAEVPNRTGRKPAHAVEVDALDELVKLWPEKTARSLPAPSKLDAHRMRRRLQYLGARRKARIATDVQAERTGYRVTFWIIELVREET